MYIQWFPGHMTKAMRMMEENVKLVDAIGYVLDARAPQSCFNPSFTKIVGNKPCVFILNKCDLSDPAKVDKWYAYFVAQGHKCVRVSVEGSSPCLHRRQKVRRRIACVCPPSSRGCCGK